MIRRELALGLVVAMTSACKKDEPAPAAEAADDGKAAADAAEAADDGEAAADHGEAAADDGEAADGGEGKGGLAGLTKDLVDEARRTSRETFRLVPDSAEYLFRARFADLLAYGPGTAVWRKIEGNDEDIRIAVDIVVECMSKLEAFEDVAVGMDTEEHLVLVAHAEAIGKDETWRCFKDKTVARGKDWDTQITGTPRGEGPQLLTDDGDTGYFVDDDTVVMVSKEWDAEMTALLAGKGTAAVEGQLAGPIGRITPDSPLWVIGRMGPEATSQMAGTPFAGMTDLSFSMRIEDEDVVFETELDAGEAADAARMKEELTKGFEEYKSFLPMMGFPASLASKIVFETEGDLVSLDFTLTKTEIDEIRGAIERTF